jgi:hypothetical protein
MKSCRIQLSRWPLVILLLVLLDVRFFDRCTAVSETDGRFKTWLYQCP